MEELKSYIREFYENGAIKPKNYLSDGAVKEENGRPIIVITNSKCTFSANNRGCKT